MTLIPSRSSLNDVSSEKLFGLSDYEQVQRHQLNILEYWSERGIGRDDLDRPVEGASIKNSDAAFTGKWSLLNGIELRDWQIECRDKWFKSGKKGIVKVVTGAGKTVMALGVIERLQNIDAPDLRVAIVVPTVVLQDQWHDLLIQSGNLPDSWIGRLGGGYQDSFENDVRVLVCVLNSAALKLPKMADSLKYPLLLIVDECHRAGSKQMSEIFKSRRTFNLGLSATPERDAQGNDDDEEQMSPDPDADDTENFNDSLIGTELGPIIHELGYREALEAGILAKFEICHFGLPLEPAERARYEKISRDITELRRTLQGSPSARGINGGALVGWARRIATRGGGLAEQAASYVSLTGQRKRLVYRSNARTKAVIRLVRKAIEASDNARILLFHESVEEVMRLFAVLRKEGVSAVAEHSQLSDSLRAGSLHLFRTGAAQVLVSARSLIEGFDVPAADVGIVVASSSSVRQRIQTLGRILRKKTGEERAAALHVLYMAQTTDESIYEKQDWAEITGADRNRYFSWDPSVDDSEPLEQIGPPRTPKPKEEDIDFSSLALGDAYPGAYEGEEYSADSQGNIRDVAGRLCSNPQGMPALLEKLRGSLGRFRVTPRKRAVLISGGEGKLIFGGILTEPFSAEPEEAHLQKSTGCTDLIVKSKSDGVRIALKIPGGEAYARTSSTALDPLRGADAELLVSKLVEMETARGIKVRKLKLYDDLNVIAEIDGLARTVATLSTGLEFQDRNLP
jgi:superfamily II DNA or RNA helicase